MRCWFLENLSFLYKVTQTCVDIKAQKRQKENSCNLKCCMVSDIVFYELLLRNHVIKTKSQLDIAIFTWLYRCSTLLIKTFYLCPTKWLVAVFRSIQGWALTWNNCTCLTCAYISFCLYFFAKLLSRPIHLRFYHAW